MKRSFELVSQKIREGMARKNVSIRELARHVQLSYEDARSIIHGQRRLSAPVARPVCEYLDIDPLEVERLLNFDELNHRFSSPTLSLAPMDRFWRYLTEEHRQDLVCLARRWAAQDRAVRRSAKVSETTQSASAAAGGGKACSELTSSSTPGMPR